MWGNPSMQFALIRVLDTVLDSSGEFTPATQERLRACLPMLEQGLLRWRQAGSYYPQHPGHLLFAAATPNREAIFISTGWPEPKPSAAQLQQYQVTQALVGAIETEPSTEVIDDIHAGLALILGPDEIDQQRQDAQALVALGHRPLIVALVDDDAILVTTVGLCMSVATVH